MSLMQWTEEKYATNVAVCDSQHRELFDRVNALNDSVSKGARDAIGESLDYLIDYVVEHFNAEEQLMEEHGYKGLEAHKQEHAQLIQTCSDLQSQFHAGESDIEDGTMIFIKNWLDHHIPVIDRSYSAVLNS